MYLRDADGVFMCYDSEESLQNLVTFWRDIVVAQAPTNCLVALIHTKTDVDGVDTDKIKQATHKVKAKVYQEVSSKEGTGINEVF